MKTILVLLAFLSVSYCFPVFYTVYKTFETIQASNATGNWSQEVNFVVQTSDKDNAKIN